MTALPIPADIQPVEPAYRSALRVQAALFWVPLLVGAAMVGRLVFEGSSIAMIPAALIAIAGALAVIVSPQRVYRRLGYALDTRLLRVVRGWLFHTDTIVPFVRVQHIDVTRGPVDKLFGTASLIVHTAGTHNSIVVLPGLSPARAAEIREAIRHEIRADSE